MALMIAPEVHVPHELEHSHFVATPLTADLAGLDHAAYVASPEVIAIHSDGRWPVDGFTLAEDLEQIVLHEADHRERRAFAFALLDPTRTAALGCLYLNPLRQYLQRAAAGPELLDMVPAASAMVTFWLRQDFQHTTLADELVESVGAWLTDDWPLALHLFRVLPAEQSSCSALERSGYRRVELPLHNKARPYLWYERLPGR